MCLCPNALKWSFTPGKNSTVIIVSQQGRSYELLMLSVKLYTTNPS